MAEMLTRAFFEEELGRLTAAYSQEIGEKRVAVTLMLRDGQSLKLEGEPTCTDTYLLCDYKGRGNIARAVIPYRSIVAVSLSVEGGGTVGFTR
ncbi:MAG: hypothetical protein ACOY93_03600 [Bacillota bacterium]